MDETQTKITAEMTIAEALRLNPQAAEIFMNYGMHCIGCVIAAGETIAQAAELHAIDINKLIEELNILVRRSSKSEGGGVK